MRLLLRVLRKRDEVDLTLAMLMITIKQIQELMVVRIENQN